jgi:hypothetical protein
MAPGGAFGSDAGLPVVRYFSGSAANLLRHPPEQKN